MLSRTGWKQFLPRLLFFLRLTVKLSLPTHHAEMSEDLGAFHSPFCRADEIHASLGMSTGLMILLRCFGLPS